MKSKQTSFEQKNEDETIDMVLKFSYKQENLSEYDKQMIETYQIQIKNGILTLDNIYDLTSLEFIQLLNIHTLELGYCDNIIPKLESKTITQLHIRNCQIQSVKNFQLDNLEILEICHLDMNDLFESKTIVQEIVMFQKLKELYLTGWDIDISSFSLMSNLTKLALNYCELGGIAVLSLLVNLEELCIDQKEVDIISLQHLTKLTKLSLRHCNLDNIYALRLLTKLEVLDISLIKKILILLCFRI
ncbi:leucine-rich_repeat domain-containing protein [Hexamita inflata]|uniref:Leucine-rich repeat domain-containing protein n=1 Tax=Hexamita inflata TaxID=28002 RepID=A0AA86R590_9EUKA|nr:leucine-rich repeat domain-containing protein [Hexamita inflata]